MNVIELAERRYHEMVPNDLVDAAPAERWTRLPASKIDAWIMTYVLPAIEEVWNRPIFRERATWPQRSLVAGVDTQERGAVERVDKALVAEAKALKGLLLNRLVQRRLDDMHRDAIAKREERAPSVVRDGVRWSVGMPEKHDLIPFYREQLRAVAERAWTDLVCTEDYFGPVGGMLRKSPLPKGSTEASMVISLMPHLFHVGDSITRCLLQRARIWTGFLAEVRGVCYEAMRRVSRKYETQADIERTAWAELQQATTDLQGYCLAGTEARIRESCITLVQVYAEFHVSRELPSELRWHGVPEHAVQEFRGQLRYVLMNQRDLETLDRIAAAVGDLKLLYRDLDPSISDRDEAIASGGLVLIEATPRKAYWNGQEIQAKWKGHRKPWELLWKLAANARMASAVNEFDLYGEGASRSTIANRWRRLKELIPASLARRVVPGGERATYRLDLRSHQIYLFRTAARTST